MASGASTSPPEDPVPRPSDQLVVNLQVVSPSVGVNRPLLFPDLPATTTIKRLKDKIRQTLPLRPADENQRLIHRGRALLRESDSLLDIFGSDALRTLDRQTIHLVIRDVADGQPPMPSTADRGPSPVDGGQATASAAGRPDSLHPQFGPEHPPSFQRRTHIQTTTHHVPQPRIPFPAPAAAPHHTPEQVAAFQQHHQNMTNWLGQIQRDTYLQREAMVRALVSQNQRGRAQMGMRGIGDPSDQAAGNDAESNNNGRASPGTSHSVYYETVGPNGHTYHVDTIIRTSTQGPVTGLSPADVHNIIRGADANQATMAMANAIQHNTPGALHNRPLTQPRVTTPVLGAGGPLAGSGQATPDLEPRSAGAGSASTASSGLPSQPQQGPQVYILSSPEGPRALVLNASATETFYTPRLRTQESLPRLRSTTSISSMPFTAQTPQSHAAPQQDQQPQPRNEPAAPAHAQPAVQPVHPNNPPAALGLPLLLELWSHAWLIFRLGLFVWFFTSPNSSWLRWFTIISLAVFMFVLSTGLLNGVAENAWRPISRLLEHLLPALEQPRAGQEAGRGRGARPGGREGELAPEQMTARLVAERRVRQSWIRAQVRRLQRAGLLFLASLAPGVAERHIANLEAEARAEESRREAEAAVAAAANPGSGEGDANGGDSHEATTGADGNADQEEQRNGQGREAAPEANLGDGVIREELVPL